MPKIYPVNITNKKKIDLPLVDFDFIDFIIDSGHAAPKHTNITASNIDIIIPPKSLAYQKIS